MSARHRICDEGDLKADSARQFEVGGIKIAVVRIGEDYYAIGDTCSHADFSLSEGDVDAEERTIECWKHGSLFSLVDGCPLSLPATRPVPVFAVEVVDDGVYVEIKDAPDE